MKLRKEVQEFAEEMEYELRRHDPEKGDSWKTMSPFDISCLLDTAWRRWDDVGWIGGDKRECRSQLVDIANIAMMLFHRLGE